MRKNYSKISKAYRFFREAEKSSLRFTLEELSTVTGWTIKTVHGYRTKKWHWFLREDNNKFFVEGISEYPEQSFIRIHTQRTDDDIRKLRPRFTERVDNLIDKARESTLLAVQTYNNPLATFRTPAYLVLMNIAFTALFHAIFEREGIDYTYKNPDGTQKIIDGETAAWELSTCIAHYYKGDNVPERENLKFLIELRNKIEHRFLPQLDVAVAGQSQAMLFNFEALLKKEFGPFFSLKPSLALALQFSGIEPFQQEAIKQICSKEYDMIRQFIDTYQRNLPPDVLQSPNYSFRVFLIPRLGNHASSSDVAIEFVRYDPTKPEEMALYEKQVAMIKEQLIQVADQGKFRPHQVIEHVMNTTGISFNMHHHTNAWKLYNIRPRTPDPKGCKTQYCQYNEPYKDFLYTEQWVQFLIEKVKDPQEFARIKNYRDTK